MKNVLSFKSKSEVVEEDKKNRIFFHDLINHTHGILLFLNQKITYNKGASSEELEILNHEVKLLQTLIQDHFKYQHKNLENDQEFVKFEDFEVSMQLLFKIYFQGDVKIAIEKKGKLAFYENEATRNSALVHYPTLYRVMNNLIKNMAEACTNEMYFHFDYTENSLIIETRNRIGQKKDKQNVVEYLSRLIMRDEVKIHESIGLDSIHEMVTKLNGNFEFDIKEEFWINKIEIPHIQIFKLEKLAA